MYSGLETILNNIHNSDWSISADKIDNLMRFISENSSNIISITMYDEILLIATKDKRIFIVNIKESKDGMKYIYRFDDLDQLYIFYEFKHGLDHLKEVVKYTNLPITIKYVYRFSSKIDYRSSKKRYGDNGNLMHLISYDKSSITLMFFHRYKIRG